MNFDVLNRTEQLFLEIAAFYVKWSAGVENVIPYLLDNPSTKRRIDVSERLRQKSTVQIIKKAKFTPVPFAVFASIDIKKLRFYKKVTVPDQYSLSGQDIYGWVYFARIVPLRDEEFNAFRNELRQTKTDAEERSRIDWLLSFKNLLDSLSQQLIVFDSAPLPMTDDSEDWLNMDRTLHDLADSHIRPLINQYEAVTRRYIPDHSSKKVNNDTESKKQRSDNTLNVAHRAVTFFEELIKNIVQRERGKSHPLSDKQIVNEAIEKYYNLAPVRGYAATDKGISRYLVDINRRLTARQYAGQVVRQERSYK